MLKLWHRWKIDENTEMGLKQFLDTVGTQLLFRNSLIKYISPNTGNNTLLWEDITSLMWITTSQSKVLHDNEYLSFYVAWPGHCTALHCNTSSQHTSLLSHTRCIYCVFLWNSVNCSHFFFLGQNLHYEKCNFPNFIPLTTSEYIGIW